MREGECEREREGESRLGDRHGANEEKAPPLIVCNISIGHDIF